MVIVHEMKTARIAAAVEEGDKITLMLGEGNHDCERWELSEALARKLCIEIFHLSTKGWFRR
jgi:hypothetical protein